MLYQPTDPFRPYLMPGERVLWTGQPKQGLALSRKDALLIPFSLMWGGFAIFWNFGVWSSANTGTADDWFFKLWGLPFLAAGLYFIIGRFFHDAMIRKNIRYAVTDRRVLILRGAQSPKLTSREISQLPMLELTEHRDGTGTIAFDGEDVGYSMLRGNRGVAEWTPSRSATFFRIEGPLKVYQLIRNQIQL